MTISSRAISAWHDPHVWRGDDAWYLALGCGFMGVGGALLLYRSDDLLDWEYLHPLCTGAQPAFNRWLVPDFFPLDGRHVLLAVATTRGRTSKKIYLTGRYQDRRFHAEHEGFTDAEVDAPGPFSCARTLTAPDGRRILFGVVNEQRPFHANPFGWASVLSLPRVLGVGEDGSLRMEPAREVCESGDPDWERLDADLNAGGALDIDLHGDALEIVAEIELREATAVGLRLRRSPDGREQTTLRYEADLDRLTIDLAEASLDPAPARGTVGTRAHLPPGEPIRLHIFLDRSVIEVFCAGRSCLYGARIPDAAGQQRPAGVRRRWPGGPSALGGLAQEIDRPVLLSASRCYDTAMMRVAVWGNDLSDTYLRTVTQLGAEAIDMGRGAFFPGVSESGYPDADALTGLVLKLRPYGLRFNRVTLPDITDEFMLGRDGADRELENTCRALRVFADAGIPIARQRFAGDTFNHRLLKYESRHRGGYRSRGESRDLGPPDPDPATHERLEAWWDRFCAVYEKLVPIADEYGIRLAIHPSDTPLPDTPLGTLGFHRVIDTFPSPNVGYLYCCGTRAEAGGPPLVMDEINLYGRKGRIFTVHLRNVRGNLATAGGFEEVLLDDGDMNMSRIVRELSRVGFDGCLNPDHLQPIEGDGRSAHQALAYSIGYIKALLTALAA